MSAVRRRPRLGAVRTRRVVVRQVGNVLLVHPAGCDDGPSRDLADALPAVPPSVVVCATAADVDPVLDRLTGVLADARRQGIGEVRLVTSAGFPDLEPARWRRLAERTDVTLLVPSGAAAQAGVTLFAAGGWTRYAPGAADSRLGPRHPEPRWQGSTGERSDPAVDHLPVGVLLRHPGSAPGPEWHAVPPDPRRLTVVVGVPGGGPVHAEDVATYLAALPTEVASTARLVCGDGRDVVALGRAVATALGTAITVVDGRPAAGHAGFVLHDRAGRPTWAPYLQEIRCEVGEVPAVPLRWRAPHPGLADHGPGVFRVTEGWVVGVLRSGLWLRRAGRSAHPLPVGAPVDPAVVVLAVGDPGEQLREDVWDVLPTLLDRLDDEVRSRVLLSVIGVAGERGLAAACALARSRGIGMRAVAG